MGCGPTQSTPHCTECCNPPINGQCTNFMLFDVALYLCTGVPTHREAQPPGGSGREVGSPAFQTVSSQILPTAWKIFAVVKLQ